ncbi:MAG TPA: hypothetical protein VFH11_11745, partial [Gemmatimonadota bacterium]|nr:hypothetical protein [Gemmatimonadota bacterium]
MALLKDWSGTVQLVCNIDPHSVWKMGLGVRQDVDESRVVTTDCGNGRFLTGNRTQEVVGSIPISSTTVNEKPGLELHGSGFSAIPGLVEPESARRAG